MNFCKHANNQTEALNNILQGVNRMTKYLLLDQTMNAFKVSLNSILAINEATTENLEDAVSNRITTNLFPVENLLRTLNVGKANFSIQPLYAEDMIRYYCLLLESTNTTDATVIYTSTPFKSLDVFEASQIVNFYLKSIRHS